MTPADETHLRKALRVAYSDLVNNGTPSITRGAVVSRALEMAMGTLNRLPDREARWLKGGGFWPDTTPDDDGSHIKGADVTLQMVAILAQVLKEDTSPSANVERLARPGPATAGALNCMDAVFQAYRDNLVGQKRVRDWKICCLSAMGKQPKWIGHLLHTSKDAVRQAKYLQACAVGKALAGFMPEGLDGAPTQMAA